jgi:predicted metal-dependent hydrolase
MTSSQLPFAYQIRRSKRASRARIVVKPGQVEIVAPHEIPEGRLHKFVQAKQTWVSQALRKMAASSPQQNGFVPCEFINGASLVYQGNAYPITINPSTLKRVKIEFNGAYTVHLPKTMNPQEHHDHIKTALIKWLRKTIKTRVEELVAKHAPRKQLFPKSIAIKTQKSRWGSCGINNDININWLLLMSPEEVLEYVVVHELCHIRIKNHSSQFWALVAEHLPDYKTRRLWLKQQGRALMLAF